MSQKDIFQSSPKDLQNTLSEVNRKMQEQEAHAQAAALHLPYIDLHNFPVDLNILGMFSEQEARECQSVPFYKELSDLRIATHQPNHPLLLEKIKELSLHNKVKLYFISQASLSQTLKFYSKVMRPKAQRDEMVRIEHEQDFAIVIKSIASEEKQASMNASEILQIIFGGSIFFKSSDIHFEPEEHFIKVRYRIDGVLQDMLHVNKNLQRSLVTRLKVLAKLKINEEGVPQDGRLTFYYLGKPVDVRISTLPSGYGEEIVMRLLGTEAVDLKLPELGFRPEVLKVLEGQLHRPNGMLITTGPTGSGKTTSLYAFINQLNEPGVKIITLEDPIEYKLEGIVQTPIDHAHDFSFAKGLRAILRQDPDIVMVGEIRDQETAETAMQAALTGHLVFSTLHTNDAAGAIPRLINMGVKPFIIGPALSCILAQRLVRKICQNCKVEEIISPSLLERIQLILKQIPVNSGSVLPEKLQFYHSPGCDFCHHLGYSGRIGIYEVLEVTDAIQELIMQEASMGDFRKQALAQGMVTMTQDGLLKALEGITDVAEVFRVAGE